MDMRVPCAFCGEPAERVCSWQLNRHRPWEPAQLCLKPVCFRCLREPDEHVYCMDHWDAPETLRYVPEYEARNADEDPLRYNPKPAKHGKGRAMRAGS